MLYNSKYHKIYKGFFKKTCKFIKKIYYLINIYNLNFLRKMKNTEKGFTLVELLVSITILAIISVVAYQYFGGAVDKANSGRKISDVSTIETSLNQFFIDKSFFPAVDTVSDTNKYGYDSSKTATRSNTLTVTKNGAEITAITGANGGGKVIGKSGDYASKQIGAKGTISQNTLGKQYLTKDLYDPELGDFKVGTKKFIEEGIGRYIYAVYKKPTGANWGTNNNTGTAYNIAITIKKEGTDDYLTKIVGPYDEKSCYDKSAECPKTLIGSGNDILVDGQALGKNIDGTSISGNYDSTQAHQGIPYPLGNF
ncbi:hypothetical protein DLH72_04740 [Candidatus Gracilibacteria bacterium]|nr:MAG: hypothetical protein DLH72_04740 [Candidatus Gracilibacteria bacterium]